MMDWINFYGLGFMAAIMVPNIIFAAAVKGGFADKYHNRIIELFEQVGRFGCFLLMVVQPPVICRGFWFSGAKEIYLALGILLVAIYLFGWVVLWKESSVRKSLLLSITPSLLFIESGVLLLCVPLIVLAVVFAFCHITISYKNAVL